MFDMFSVVIKFRGLTQLNILVSYLSLVNSFQLTMVLLKENCILPVIVYLPTVETNKNCYNFSYFNHITCQYCTVAVKLSIVQTANLNACWNSVFCQIFCFHKSESVRCFMNGLGKLDFIHIRMKRVKIR